MQAYAARNKQVICINMQVICINMHKYANNMQICRYMQEYAIWNVQLYASICTACIICINIQKYAMR